MTKPTPGPWTYEKSRGGKWYVYGADTKPILIPNVSATKRSREEMDSNSRLIAAAPELLEAAKIALEAAELEWGVDSIPELTAAIAKAEGRT